MVFIAAAPPGVHPRQSRAGFRRHQRRRRSPESLPSGRPAKNGRCAPALCGSGRTDSEMRLEVPFAAVPQRKTFFAPPMTFLPGHFYSVLVGKLYAKNRPASSRILQGRDFWGFKIHRRRVRGTDIRRRRRRMRDCAAGKNRTESGWFSLLLSRQLRICGDIITRRNPANQRSPKKKQAKETNEFSSAPVATGGGADAGGMRVLPKVFAGFGKRRRNAGRFAPGSVRRGGECWGGSPAGRPTAGGQEKTK